MKELCSFNRFPRTRENLERALLPRIPQLKIPWPNSGSPRFVLYILLGIFSFIVHFKAKLTI